MVEAVLAPSAAPTEGVNVDDEAFEFARATWTAVTGSVSEDVIPIWTSTDLVEAAGQYSCVDPNGSCVIEVTEIIDSSGDLMGQLGTIVNCDSRWYQYRGLWFRICQYDQLG